MTCEHRPISNGWSGGGTRFPITWCGRCKAYVEVDEAWAEKYYDKRAERIKKQADYLGERRMQNALDANEEDRQHLLRLIRSASVPS